MNREVFIDGLYDPRAFKEDITRARKPTPTYDPTNILLAPGINVGMAAYTSPSGDQRSLESKTYQLLGTICIYE